jgi:hypothetical protein
MQPAIAVCRVAENHLASVAGFFRGEGYYVAQNHSAIAPEAGEFQSARSRF